MTVMHEYLFQNKKGELVLPVKGAVLKGRAYRDIRFYTGQIIKTSKIKGFYRNVAVTKSSHYELGSPAQEYIEFSNKISIKASICFYLLYHLRALLSTNRRLLFVNFKFTKFLF